MADGLTEPQTALARKLGIPFDDYTTPGELGNAIAESLRTQRPTLPQIEFAHNLGIPFDEVTITAKELSRMLDAEIARQSQEALRDNPVLIVGETVEYKGEVYEITSINRRRWRIQLKPCFKGHGRGVRPLIITLKDAVHVNITS